jgi:hypothetical protein
MSFKRSATWQIAISQCEGWLSGPAAAGPGCRPADPPGSGAAARVATKKLFTIFTEGH